MSEKVTVCSQNYERDCEAEGEEICTTEKETGLIN